jgi:hypothetical protein
MKNDNFNPAFIQLIKDATKAPSGHNTQPWKFMVNENQIILKPDYSKRLKVVDPDDHELFISLGCALENLTLSAKAHNISPKVDMNFKDGYDEIVVDLTESKNIQKDNLYDFISSRQTTRSEYKATPISKEILDQLTDLEECDDVQIMLFTHKQQIEGLTPYIIEGSNLQFANKEFVEELVSWCRFSKKAAQEKGDGLWSASMGFPNMPKSIGSFVMKNFVSAKSEAKRWANLIEKSAGFALFVVKENTKSNWVELGRRFQRFALKSAQLNIRHAHVNMPCEEIEVRKKMMAEFKLGTRHPLLLIRFGYADTMPYSLRRPIEDVIEEGGVSLR